MRSVPVIYDETSANSVFSGDSASCLASYYDDELPGKAPYPGDLAPKL
jgi:hypothetical protein